MEKILLAIKQEIKVLCKNYDALDFFTIHFCICRQIRNKYLWSDTKLLEKLKIYFKTENIDEISYYLFLSAFAH